jgi:MmyB-like transcription regulator ligand binding domain
VRRLVEELRRASPLFERLWAEHDVAVRHVDRKRVPHPTVGLLALDCEALLTPEHDQRLILSTAPAGTETAEKLELLRVVGLQQLVPENHPLMADNRSNQRTVLRSPAAAALLEERPRGVGTRPAAGPGPPGLVIASLGPGAGRPG